MSQPAEAVAIRALLASVEGGSDNTTKGDRYNCKKLIQLFEPAGRKDSLVAGHTIKQQATLLVRSLQTCSKGQLKRFFNDIKTIVETIIQEEFYGPKITQGDNEDVESYTQEDPQAKECLLFLQYVAICVRAILDARILKRQQETTAADDETTTNSRLTNRPLRMPSPVVDVALSLHDILFEMHSCGTVVARKTKHTVLNLCEAWWLDNAEQRETLIVQCLPLLVLRACEEEDCFTNKTHIQRLYKLRHAFQCIDFADHSSQSLRKLVLRVASNPLCLKLSEGKKFLSSLMQDVDLMKDLHLSFKAQIPSAKDSLLQAYGEIYHRTWKDAKETARTESGLEDSTEDDFDSSSIVRVFEIEILQDLMNAAVHVASHKTFVSVLTVLDPIHIDKKNKDIASMLHRLYNPILWRSLTATNPIVRQNAILLLEKVFPLHEPFSISDQNNTKSAVLKGTKALGDALVDVDPVVRVAASKATANICKVFWEALPAGELRRLLNVIVFEHSSDRGSAHVRAASVEAVTILLGTDHSQGVLRPLLPSMGNLLHDKAEKVRLAVVRMLIRIKTIQGVRFYHVVPLDHLLARLVAEAEKNGNPRTSVTKGITELLLNSYLPQGDNGSASEQLKRTMSFLLTNPNASSIFYANVTDFLEVEVVVKFIIVLCNCVKSSVASDQDSQLRDMSASKKRQHSTTSKASKDKSSGLTSQASPEDTALMAGLSNTINVLWESVALRLDTQANLQSKYRLQRYVGGKEFNIVSVLEHYEQKGLESDKSTNDTGCSKQCFHICTSLLACARRLDQKAVEETASLVSSSLKNIANKVCSSNISFATSIAAFLCAAGHVDEVSKSLAMAIDSSFPDESSLPLSPSLVGTIQPRRSRRSLSKKDKDSIFQIANPSIAWSMFDGILNGSGPDSVYARDAIMKSEDSVDAFLAALRKSIQHAERFLMVLDGSLDTFPEKEEAEWIIRGCEAYGRFTIHKHTFHSSNSGFESTESLDLGALLKWTTDVVVKVLLAESPGPGLLQDLDISYISNTTGSVLHLPPCSPSASSPPKQRQNRNKTPDTMRGHTAIPTGDREATRPSPAKIFASSLMLSSCMILSECLAVGVSSPVAIMEASFRWCDLFETLNAYLLDSLFPAFARLGLQLKRASGSTELLERLFIACNQSFVNEDQECYLHAKETARSLIGKSRPEMDSFISLFLALVERIVPLEHQGSLKLESKDCLSEICSHGGSLAIFLEVLDSNTHAKDALARALKSTLSGADERDSPIFVFKANCLLALSRTMERRALTEIFEGVDVEVTVDENNITSSLREILESHA